LASQPILRPPDFRLPFCLAVDASGVALGANLFQVIEGIEHPIAYYSKRLNIHQQRYSTVEQEALALITACRVFSVYFGSLPVTVYSDHSPLQFIQKMANYNQKLLRWSLELQQYNLTIKHRAGRNNLIPDILSRPSA
jgi:phospholipid-translocating ATPase